MTLRKIIAASSLAMVAGLAGCSSHDDMQHHMANANYLSSGNYMHDSSAGQILTTPDGMMPQLISDRPKVASSAAIARSHETSGVNAPPKHQPFTIAMVGLE